ncbi:MAG: hypothetical protein M1405_01605 [Patescibacteria group bacterium]|nr:hypothetical protein [Patescibacteria group bacterium]
MKFKLPKFPKFTRLPRFNIEPVRKIMAFLIKHKIPATGLVFVIAFIAVALWYRGYLISKMNAVPDNASSESSYSLKSDSPLPTNSTSPTPSDTPDTTDVLGTSTKNSASYNNVPLTLPTPFPTFAPLPTIAPLPITTTTNTSSGNNTPANPNCTTGAGVPNSWYSDVYPNPSASSTNTGSITLYVYIRDCNKNTAPVSDKLNISLSSGDSNTQINEHSLPYSVTTQNGIASFTVSSQVSGIVTLVVQDATSNFTVTNIYNNNPSITFTNTTVSGNSTGNSNCTTASGVANFWYSEVSPASPIPANTGSTVILTVNIKDCNKNNVSSDNLTFSQTSNDSSLTVNGHAPPITVQAQNGVATFNVTSQNAGTDTFTIQDTTSNFTVTDANNHNPSIVFSGSSPIPTPAPSATPTPSPSGSPTPTPSPSGTPTPTPSPSATPTPT